MSGKLSLGVLCVLAALLAAAPIICILVKLQGIRKKEQSKRKDSGTPAPPAEGDFAADVWKAVFVSVIICILVKCHVIPISEKGGDPVVNGEELKELRTGAAEGG
ncbi:hypothetical protein OYC64_016325 [Pagothenia borchgrevinki]|uniref:Uncharacterized protein n=1 Tax=Pagothenia borchgrevinki TaxID=8213 RepID=A0ABD2HJT9_PAGBO